MDEPLAPDAAKKLIREILRAGRFIYSRHAKEELLADDLTTVDCENVLRGGVVRPGEFEAIGITAAPCGGCRQWLYEFRFDEVSYAREDGSIATKSPAELLPDTWDLP